MELEDALFKWVQTQSTITSHIGPASPGQPCRLYKLKAPQKTAGPFMVMQRSGADRQYLACGIDGAVPVSLQIDSYAPTWAAAAAAARAFQRALRPDAVNSGAGYPVWMGDGDSPSVAVKVKLAAIDNEFDGEDPDPGLARRTQLWTFWIWEP